MSRRIALAAAAAMTCAAVAGCSSGTVPGGSDSAGGTSLTSQAPQPTPVTSTATGAHSFGSFAFVVPMGWTQDASRQTKGVVAYLKAPQAVAGVIPTFTVATNAPTALPSLDDLVQQAVIALRQAGATVTAVADRTIGGENAKGYTATSSVATPGATGKQPISQTQYFVEHGNLVYITTMTSATGSAAQLAATQDSILRSWSWSTS